MKDLSQVVEGPWGDYIFKIAGPSEYPEVSAFLWDNYYKDEPITLLLGFSEKKAKDMDNVVKQFLEDSLSLMAVHQETGKVAAVRIAYDSRRKLNLTETYSSKENLKVQVAKDRLVEMAEKRLKECYFEEVYAMGFLSSVAPEHRGKGLASEIYARSLRQFVERGFQLTRNFFSSKFTMRIVRKLGYEELGRVYLNKLKDAKGHLVFPDADDDFYATFMAKRLSD